MIRAHSRIDAKSSTRVRGAQRSRCVSRLLPRPIIADALIYVTDVRNGLYVLKYKGPHARQIHGIAFLEGNSNQGDALCFEPVGPAGRHCD